MLRHTITRNTHGSSIEAIIEETGQDDLVRIISYRRMRRHNSRRERVKHMEGTLCRRHQITGEPPPNPDTASNAND